MRVNKHIIQRYSDLNVYRHPEKPPVYIAIGGSVYTPDFIYFWQIGDVPHATDVPYKSPELRRLWGQNVECLRSESLRGERPFEKNDNMYEFLWKPLGLSEKAFDSIDNIKAWEMPTFNEEMKKLGYTKEKLMIKHKYIDEVEEGDIVQSHQPNYGDIAIVKKCVHGNLYYACYEDDTIDTSTLPLVADADRNHIECCSQERKLSMKQIHYTELTNAIIIAMEDYMDNNAFTPHNPAILYDGERSYYGSKLHGDRVLFDLADGFGFYTPEDEDDIPCAADALATAIVNETPTN